MSWVCSVSFKVRMLVENGMGMELGGSATYLISLVRCGFVNFIFVPKDKLTRIQDVIYFTLKKQNSSCAQFFSEMPIGLFADVECI